MVITLSSELEAGLTDQARRRGMAPEALALDVLRRHLLPPVPADEWERRLFGAAVDRGVSVPDAALSSDGLYHRWPSSSTPASSAAGKPGGPAAFACPSRPAAVASSPSATQSGTEHEVQ